MMDVMHTTLYVTTSLRTWSRSAASTTRRTRPHRWMSTIETILTREAHRLDVQLDDEDEPRVDDVMRSPEHLRAADAQELLARTLCHCQRFVSIESSDSMVRGSATSRTHTRSSLSQTADAYSRPFMHQASTQVTRIAVPTSSASSATNGAIGAVVKLCYAMLCYAMLCYAMLC